jgi:hypothetical protein
VQTAKNTPSILRSHFYQRRLIPPTSYVFCCYWFFIKVNPWLPAILSGNIVADF